jgi:hypothetical protein
MADSSGFTGEAIAPPFGKTFFDFSQQKRTKNKFFYSTVFVHIVLNDHLASLPKLDAHVYFLYLPEIIENQLLDKQNRLMYLTDT